MLRRFLLAAAAVAAAACVLVPAAPAGAASNCLPDGNPLFVDYANPSVQFRDELFKRPGLVLTMEDVPTKKAGDPAQAFRAAGAVTTFWDEHIEKIVGTPGSPAPAGNVAAATAQLATDAIASSGCKTPLVALNELVPPGGASAANMARYRANVLTMIQTLNNASERAVLLLPATTPTGAGPAADFLKQAGGMADLVAEVYFNNNALFSQGALLASRTIRIGLRQRIATLEGLGLPASGLGVMLGFQSARGQGGREGLQPTASWLEMVKLQALAGIQVGSDSGLHTIWSWGWGTFDNPGSADPDKPAAACVYLWSRDPSLCDAPGRAQFNTDRNEGQIQLAAGVQCSWDGGTIALRDYRRLARALKGDQARALGALLERGVLNATTRVRGALVRRAERQIIASVYKGSARKYSQALRTAKLGRTTARQIIGDQLAAQATAAKVLPQTYPVWLGGVEKTALNTTTCLLDQVPAAGHVDLTTNFPFLRVGAKKTTSPAQPTKPKKQTTTAS